MRISATPLAPNLKTALRDDPSKVLAVLQGMPDDLWSQRRQRTVFLVPVADAGTRKRREKTNENNDSVTRDADVEIIEDSVVMLREAA